MSDIKISGKYRFYCSECKHFLDRLNVITTVEDNRYFCKFCCSPVIQTKYVMEDMLKDYIEYIISRGDKENFE